MNWGMEGELLVLMIVIGSFIWITMRKVFLDFLIFAVAAILLLNVIVWGQSGFRGWAIGGILVLAVMPIFLNRRRLAQALQIDYPAEPGETLAVPENRKAQFVRVLKWGLWGLWLVMIGIAAGIFGKNPYLHYVFIAIIVIGVASTLITRFWKVDISN